MLVDRDFGPPSVSAREVRTHPHADEGSWRAASVEPVLSSDSGQTCELRVLDTTTPASMIDISPHHSNMSFSSGESSNSDSDSQDFLSFDKIFPLEVLPSPDIWGISSDSEYSEDEHIGDESRNESDSIGDPAVLNVSDSGEIDIESLRAIMQSMLAK